MLPEDRLRLIANGSVIASAALFIGAAQRSRRCLDAARRHPALVRDAARSCPVPCPRSPRAWRPRFRRGLGAKLDARGRPWGRGRASLTLGADLAELCPSLRRVGELASTRPPLLVAGVRCVRLLRTAASQWVGTDVAQHASIVLSGLFSGSSRSRRSWRGTSSLAVRLGSGPSLAELTSGARSSPGSLRSRSRRLLPATRCTEGTAVRRRALGPGELQGGCSRPTFCGAGSCGPSARATDEGAFGAPGLQMAVAVDGKVVWSEVCGFADVRTRRPVTRTTLLPDRQRVETVYRHALARLFQAGKVSLDTPVQRLVPEFKATQPVTLRQLAGHQAGVRHYQGAEALSRTHYKDLTAALEVFASGPAPVQARKRLSLLELRLQPDRSGDRACRACGVRDGAAQGSAHAARPGSPVSGSRAAPAPPPSTR